MVTRTMLLLALAFSLAGCSKSDPNLPGFKVETGDAGKFVLRWANAFGARPLKTTNSPLADAQWRYKADNDGIQIYIVGDRTSDVRSLLADAFGPPAMSKTNADGRIFAGVYAAPIVGAAIQFGEDNSAGSRYTTVTIVAAAAFK